MPSCTREANWRRSRSTPPLPAAGLWTIIVVLSIGAILNLSAPWRDPGVALRPVPTRRRAETAHPDLIHRTVDSRSHNGMDGTG